MHPQKRTGINKNNIDIMETKRDMLISLIEKCIFANSVSSMCKMIGRTDKHVLSRLSCEERTKRKKNTKKSDSRMKDNTIDELIQQICNGYEIEEATLWHMPHLWETAIELSKGMDKTHFLRLYQGQVSFLKSTKLKKELQQLQNEYPFDYYHLLAWVYARMCGLNPNRMRKTEVLVTLLKDVDTMLYKQYPEANSSHYVAAACIRQAQDLPLSGWTHLMVYLGHVMYYYRYTDDLLKAIHTGNKIMPFLPVQWLMEDHADEEKTTLWRVIGENGIYNVLQVQADKNQPFNPDNCTMQRWCFMLEPTKLVVHIHKPQDGTVDSITYFYYELEDDDLFEIRLQLDCALCGTKHIELPSVLHPVLPDNPWMKWIEQQDKDMVQNTLRKLVNLYMGQSDTDIEVTDVQMNRQGCTVLLRNGQKTANLFIDKENHPFLEKITVWDEVEVNKQTTDGEYCLCWYTRGLTHSIPSEIIQLLL